MSAADDAPTTLRGPAAATAESGAPLLTSLHVENLKSLAGEHEIRFAPLTLIYGPNAAGKSTIIQGLRIFMDAVRAGRRDALNPFWECFQKPGTPSLGQLLSDHDAESALSIGVRLPPMKATASARATLGFGLSPVPDAWWQYSEIAINDEPAHRKDISFHLPAPDAVEPVYVVDGERVRGDHELFAGSMHSVEDRLFDLASHLVFLGPHRGDPGAVYEPGREPFRRHIANRDTADPERMNATLERLDVPYRFRIADPSEGDSLRFRSDWQLVDARTNVEVGLDQVGYGVSQMLPIVGACLRSSDQLICIEQPELHIHPRLQAKLGNLFAAAVLDGNQIIAETHSESLMLRVRRLIRQNKLRSEHVAIVYVDNKSGDRASVRHLRLGDEGELLDPWPTGFFDDSLADILGVIE